ncbi:ABC transporter permease [Candidatus Woesearchaeota archaeon]|nr:ABC transporter permease [Candidatus Woesearchaeota archaeon]
MKLRKTFKHALNMVLHSKLRSWLTILGIVIGVASVISIVAIGAGMEKSVTDQMSGLGADILTVTSGYSKAMSAMGPGRFRDEGGSSSSDPITNKDVQALKGVYEIKYMDTRISGRADVYYVGESSSVSVTGVDPKVWKEITTDEVGEGRLLDAADTNVVVIGARLATETFEREIGINKLITIGDKLFRVVGILEDGTGNEIYMPINSAYDVLEDSTRGEYDSIVIQVKEDVDVDNATEKIEKKLMLSRHVTEKTRDFSVSSSAQMMSMVSSMTSTITGFLTGIAAISLLVGAVGIANTMFTSVLEKTKTIGIMKAIGARDRDILLIFLFNAGIIGFVGGLLGIALGALIAQGMVAIGMTAVVELKTVFISLAVSIIVGMISGFIPAYQGSQLHPVDALRYE